MGFGGSGSMNVILKNNRALLNKRDKFKKPLGGYESIKNTEYDLPKSTPRILREIREKVKRENLNILKKRMILFSFIVVSLICILVYVL